MENNYRPIEFTLLSAKDLKVDHVDDMSLSSKIDVYGVVSITSTQEVILRSCVNAKCTPVAKDCGTNPSWNYTIIFIVDEIPLQHNCLTVVIKLMLSTNNNNKGDKQIVRYEMPLQQLLDLSKKKDPLNKSFTFVTTKARIPNGEEKGSLDFAFKFGDKFTTFDPPVQKKNRHAPTTTTTAWLCVRPATSEEDEEVKEKHKKKNTSWLDVVFSRITNSRRRYHRLR
ncbi:hypothetical protein ACFE04_023063 [Oxalis oulophora]